MMAIGLAHLLNYKLRGSTFFRVAMLTPYATSVAAATLVFVLLFGRDYGMINWALDAGRDRPVDWQNRQWPSQIAVSVDRDLALDRLQRADLSGGDAGHPARPVRVGGPGRRLALAAVPARDRSDRCGRRSCSRWSSRRSARPSCSASRCCSTAAAARRAASEHQYQTLGLYLYDQGWVNRHLGRASAIAWTMFLILLIVAAVNLLITRRLREVANDHKSTVTTTLTPRSPRRTARTRRGAAGRLGAGKQLHAGPVTYVVLVLFTVGLALPAGVDGDRGLARPTPGSRRRRRRSGSAGTCSRTWRPPGTRPTWARRCSTPRSWPGPITVGTVLFSTLAGFAFAKLRFRGRRRLLMLIIIGTMMIPPQLSVVPLYMWIAELDWAEPAADGDPADPGQRLRCRSSCGSTWSRRCRTS